MSQAEFAHAIGLSRETVGRIERGAESIDRRTELAMRYIAEGGTAELQSLPEIHQIVSDILDEAAVRGRISLAAAKRLRGVSSEWAEAGGSATGAALLLSAQGTLGMLSSTGEDDPYRDKFFAELRQLKKAWRAVADDLR
jgi:transcriptional regulator with XRE-family HTH domain